MQQPGYRPPLAVGQQYPALGYGPDGAPRFTYQPDPDPTAQTRPVEPEVPQHTPPPPPDPRESRQRMLLGAVGVLVVVLFAVGVFKLMSQGDDPGPEALRDNAPVSQNTTDPYLPKSIEPTDEVPGETTPPAQAMVDAELAVDAEPGSAVAYIDSGQVEFVQMTTAHWKQTVRATTRQLQIRVVVAPGSPASCRITVDGQVVADEEASGDEAGVLVCSATR